MDMGSPASLLTTAGACDVGFSELGEDIGHTSRATFLRQAEVLAINKG
jgi:hypothetical protein